MPKSKKMSNKTVSSKHKSKSKQRKLHVKKGEEISESKLNRAALSKKATLRKEAILAKPLKKLHKKL